MAKPEGIPEFKNINEAIEHVESTEVSTTAARLAKLCANLRERMIRTASEALKTDASWSPKGTIQLADFIMRIQGMLAEADTAVVITPPAQNAEAVS